MIMHSYLTNSPSATDRATLFERTASRLAETCSEDYLKRERR